MQLNDIFSTEGLLKQKFPNYKVREGQVKMASLVLQAIQEKKNAIIEGSVGCGKGLGYLIPIILSGEKVIVSTSNKSLQDQLDKKDLPDLEKVFDKKLSWTVIKGKSNYFCQSNFENNIDDIKRELSWISSDYNFSNADLMVQNIAQWAEKETIGDLEYLPMELPFKVRELIACNNQTVHEKDSKEQLSCFAFKAKQKAQVGQIILVNHSLLALDISIRKKSEGYAKILPDIQIVVIDEAHDFEKQAILAFSDEISLLSLYHLLNWSLLKKVFSKAKQQELIKSLYLVLHNYLPEWGGKYYAQRKEVKFDGLETVINGIEDVIYSLSSVKIENDKTEIKIKEIKKEAKNLQDRLKEMSKEDENTLRWAEARNNAKGEPIIKLRSVPLDISVMLKEGLFKDKAVICTSATLSVYKKFDFFKQQIGISDNCLELIAPSPFNFREQALVYITDGSQDKEWEVSELLKMSKGRAFILYTSYADMDKGFQYIKTQYPKIKQGQNGMTRSQILEQFKNTPNAVLFATKSFWEGVDIVGEKLSLVVIWKIPFENPRDLVFSSKCEKIDKKAGRGVSFIRYAVPDACLKLKQGSGRLIRSSKDFGVIALLDPRINHASYKNMIIESLPPSYRTQQLEKVKSFFEKINKIQI